MKQISAFSVYQKKSSNQKKKHDGTKHSKGKISKKSKKLSNKLKYQAKALKGAKHAHKIVENQSDDEPPMLVDIQNQNAFSQNPKQPNIEKQKAKKKVTQCSNGLAAPKQNGVPSTSTDASHVKTKKKKNKNKKRKLSESSSSEVQTDKKNTKVISLNKGKIKKVNEEIKKGIDVGDSSEDEFRLSDMEECIELSDNGEFFDENNCLDREESLDDEELEESSSDDDEVVEKTLEYKSDDENAFINGKKLFHWMISPTTVSNFFNGFWEKKPLHISRKQPRYFRHILDSKTLDKILRHNNLLFEKNIDVVTYENGVRETLNPHDGRATPSVVWDFYSNGCSVRVKNPQTYHKKLQAVLTELQEFFGSYVGVNLYLTPKGSQGFAPHWDDIEAFVIQLEGRKHWKLYQPKNKCDVLSRFSSHNLKETELGPKIMDVTVNPGDLLYFPRGTVHQARTDDDHHSMHLTISVYQRTSYADLLEHVLPAALKQAAENDIEFREGLPLQYLKHVGEVNKGKATELRQHIMEKVENLLSKLFTSEAVDIAADKMGKRLMQESLPPVPYDLETVRTSILDGDALVNGEVVNRVEIQLDTKVRLLRHHCVRLVKEYEGNSEMVKLYYTTQNELEYNEESAKHLTLELSHIPIVETLQNSYPKYVPIEKLGGSNPQVNLEVVGDLWELGLIVTQEQLPEFD